MVATSTGGRMSRWNQRLTPNGRRVRARTLAMPSRSASGVRLRAARMPSPPGLADLRDEVGPGDAAHAGLENGVLDAQQVAEVGAERAHGLTPPDGMVPVILAGPPRLRRPRARSTLEPCGARWSCLLTMRRPRRVRVGLSRRAASRGGSLAHARRAARRSRSLSSGARGAGRRDHLHPPHHRPHRDRSARPAARRERRPPAHRSVRGALPGGGAGLPGSGRVRERPTASAWWAR